MRWEVEAIAEVHGRASQEQEKSEKDPALSDVEERSCTEVTHDTHKHMFVAHSTRAKGKKKRSGERAQWTKVIAAKAEGLGSIPGTDMVEGENRLPPS